MKRSNIVTVSLIVGIVLVTACSGGDRIRFEDNSGGAGGEPNSTSTSNSGSGANTTNTGGMGGTVSVQGSGGGSFICENPLEKPCSDENERIVCVTGEPGNGCYDQTSCLTCVLQNHTVLAYCDFEISTDCLYKCEDLWENCNNDWSDGCETPLVTTDNCGSCGNKCEEGPKHEQKICEKQLNSDYYQCKCGGAWVDCNNDQSDGCEKDFWDANSCGGCNIVCAINQKCQFGTCVSN